MKRKKQRSAVLLEKMLIRFFCACLTLFLFLWFFFCCHAPLVAEANKAALSDPFSVDGLYLTRDRLQAVYNNVQERLAEVSQEKDRLVALYERLRIDAEELEAELDIRPDTTSPTRFLPLEPPSKLEPAVAIPPNIIHTTEFWSLEQSYQNAKDESKSARSRSFFTQTTGLQAWGMLLRAPEASYRYEIALAKARATIIAYRNYLEKWELAKTYLFDAMEIVRSFPDDENKEMARERRIRIEDLRGRYATKERQIDLRDYAEWQDTVLTLESKRNPVIDELETVFETLAKHYPWTSTQWKLDDTETPSAPITPERPRLMLPRLPSSPPWVDLAPLGLRQINDTLYAARKFRAFLQEPAWETFASESVDTRLSELNFWDGEIPPVTFRSGWSGPEGLVPRFRGEPVRYHAAVSTLLQLEDFKDVRISILHPPYVVCGVAYYLPEPEADEKIETDTRRAEGTPDLAQLRDRSESAFRLVTDRIETHQRELETSLQLEQRLRETYKKYGEQARLMQNELQQIPDLAILEPYPPTFDRSPFDLHNMSMLEQQRQLATDMFQALASTFDHLLNPGFSSDALKRAGRWAERHALDFLYAAPVLLIDGHLLMTQRLLDVLDYRDYLEKWNLHREFIERARALHLQRASRNGRSGLNEREQLHNEYGEKEKLLHAASRDAWEEIVTARTASLNELFRQVEQLLQGIPPKSWDDRPWLYKLPVSNLNWPQGLDFKRINDRFDETRSDWVNLTSLHLYLFFRHPLDFGVLRSETGIGFTRSSDLRGE